MRSVTNPERGSMLSAKSHLCNICPHEEHAIPSDEIGVTLKFIGLFSYKKYRSVFAL